jgi:hypothetical protein
LCVIFCNWCMKIPCPVVLVQIACAVWDKHETHIGYTRIESAGNVFVLPQHILLLSFTGEVLSW